MALSSVAAAPDPQAVGQSPALPETLRQLAGQQITEFDDQANVILADYRVAVAEFERDRITAEQFASRLESQFEPRWAALGRDVETNPWLGNPQLVDIRSSLAAVPRHWRGFSLTYARGLRERDSARIRDAYAQLTLAYRSRSRAVSLTRGAPD